jgi:chromosomal replication initiator protein
MYLARELTPMSLTEIARGFDRDHTTVLHALRAVDGRLEPGSETSERIHKIRIDLGTPDAGSRREGTDEPCRPPDPQP